MVENVSQPESKQIGGQYRTEKMAKPTILIVGTLDTKLEETLFLRDQILSSGACSVKVRTFLRFSVSAACHTVYRTLSLLCNSSMARDVAAVSSLDKQFAPGDPASYGNELTKHIGP